MTVLAAEVLDIAEQLESSSTLTAVFDASAILSALQVEPTTENQLIADLVALGAIEPFGEQNGYVLTLDAREGLRERWARGWAEAFWPAEP